MTESDILDVLRRVRYPGFTRDIVSFGVVRDIAIDAGRVGVRIDLGPGTPAAASRIEQSVREALSSLPGVAEVVVTIGSGGAGPVAPGAPLPVAGPPGSAHGAAPSGGLDGRLIPEVRHVVAVASGKGGVGKSTVAVNLAVAMARRGARVGLLDADVYGPSIPLMMGVDERPSLDPTGRAIVPFERYGVRFMSLGFLVDRDAAVIWRGPMVMKAIETLLGEVAWGPLDVLIVDMPPGTGDAQLTLSQKIRLAGAVIVTTPQDVALADAIKGIAMFRKVGVPVLGVVENMSTFRCPHCNARTEIFGHGGGRDAAERLAVPFLGEIELDPAIRDGGDTGRPVVATQEDAPQAVAFLEVADQIRAALAAQDPDDRSGGAHDWLRRWTGP